MITTRLDRQQAVALAALICERCRDEEPDDGLDFIFGEVDTLLLACAFDVVDALLDQDFGGLPTVHLLGLLTITAAAADKLSRRSEFAQRVREIVTAREPDDVDELMRGLE
jgi:hypothetical protein